MELKKKIFIYTSIIIINITPALCSSDQEDPTRKPSQKILSIESQIHSSQASEESQTPSTFSILKENSTSCSIPEFALKTLSNSFGMFGSLSSVAVSSYFLYSEPTVIRGVALFASLCWTIQGTITCSLFIHKNLKKLKTRSTFNDHPDV